TSIVRASSTPTSCAAPTPTPASARSTLLPRARQKWSPRFTLAPIWRPTVLAVSLAGGRFTLRTARRWPSRLTRCLRPPECGTAVRVVRLDLTNNRLVPNAMEPRAAIGEFNRATGEYTLYTTSQNPHVIRLLMGAFVLHIPEARLRVVAPDVGGGFGSKIYHYAEEAIVT